MSRRRIIPLVLSPQFVERVHLCKHFDSEIQFKDTEIRILKE